MRYLLSILLTFLCLQDGTPFLVRPSKSPRNLLSHPCQRHEADLPLDSTSSLAIILNPVEYALSPTSDLPPASSVFLGQAALLTLTVLAEVFTAFKFAPPEGLKMVGDSQSFLLAIGLSLPLVLASYLVDKVPLPDTSLPQRLSRSNRVFALRLLGRYTPLLSAIATTLLIAFGAGNTDE